jgi:hypothetical protein
MSRLRIAFRAFWVTALVCLVWRGADVLPYFFVEPPNPSPYGFDHTLYYELADLPRVLGQVLLWTVASGAGAFIGAALLRIDRHPRLFAYFVAAALTMMLPEFAGWLLPPLWPSTWVRWALDNAMGLMTAYVILWVVFWTALGTWMCLRWAPRKEPHVANSMSQHT